MGLTRIDAARPRHRIEQLTQPVIAIQSATKVFEDGAVEALGEIDLSIGEGEFVSLIGPSGCGKSTLLRLVGDLLKPTTGAVEIQGSPAHQARLERQFGMVFQRPNLFEWRSVRENIELPLEVMRYTKSNRRAKSQELLELVQLEDFSDHQTWQLSGGMQQRVAIARALAFEPPILLMDEPFGALDEMTRERMQLELLQLWERLDTTILFVTHSIPEAVFLSNRVVVMSERPGRILEEISVDLTFPRTVETREQEAYYAKLSEVRDALRSGATGDDTSSGATNTEHP